MMLIIVIIGAVLFGIGAIFNLDQTNLAFKWFVIAYTVLAGIAAILHFTGVLKLKNIGPFQMAEPAKPRTIWSWDFVKGCWTFHKSQPVPEELKKYVTNGWIYWYLDHPYTDANFFNGVLIPLLVPFGAFMALKGCTDMSCRVLSLTDSSSTA